MRVILATGQNDFKQTKLEFGHLNFTNLALFFLNKVFHMFKETFLP